MIQTSNTIHRKILNGILHYAHQHGPWEFHMITGLFGEHGITRTKEWGCTGAIAFTDTPAYTDAALKADVPVVFINPPNDMLRDGSPLASHCCVIRDHVALGRTGADYFLDRQYTGFAYVGDANNSLWSSERGTGLATQVEAKGFRCDLYPALSPEERDDFAVEGRRLRRWLKRLPKPVAIMAAHDHRARQVLDTCMDGGISVPHEIAVLGVGNDDILCETTTPPLSSIELDGENTGFDCARLLDERMHDAKAAWRPCVLSLSMAHVVTRRSTDTFCIADPLVAKAMACIHERLGMPLTVTEIARRLNVSRRLLEIKAKKTIGRTVYDEIQRLKLNRARSLLRNTKLTVSEIAVDCGFCGPSHLGLWFRKVFQTTPTAFRTSFQHPLSRHASNLRTPT